MIALGVTTDGYRAGRLSPTAVAVLSGLQVAYATYLVFWFVDITPRCSGFWSRR